MAASGQVSLKHIADPAAVPSKPSRAKSPTAYLHPRLTRTTGRPGFHTLLYPGLWVVAKASPSCVCLGCRSVRSFSLSLLTYFVCFMAPSLLCCPVLFPFPSVSGVRSFFFASCVSASCCCSCREGGGGVSRVGGYVCCGVCVFSPASPASKQPDRCLLVHSMLASSLVPSSCFLSVFLFVCGCFMVPLYAWRLRPLGLGLTFLRRRLADSRSPIVPTLLPLLASVFLPMADAAAPAVPRQQRRKEARAQAQDDSRRVRQRLEDLESRLETLEGRSRGHGLRLQYLEAPLKLVYRQGRSSAIKLPLRLRL